MKRQPAMIIYTDGTAEQLQPVSITFYEQVAQMLNRMAQQYKNNAMISPPEQVVSEESE